MSKVKEIKELITQLDPEPMQIASDFLEFLYQKRLNKDDLKEDVKEVVSKVDRIHPSDLVSALKVIRCLVTEQELEQLSLDMENIRTGSMPLDEFKRHN